jgi:ABC-2 type transport system permease protein
MLRQAVLRQAGRAVRAVLRRAGNSLAGWRIAARVTALNFRAATQYRGDFAVAVFMGLAWQTSVLVFAGVLLGRFHGLGGWTPGDVLLIVAMRMLSHGIVAAVFSNLWWVPFVVAEGMLDGYLMRPLPVYRQIMLAQFPVNALGDSSAAVALFALALAKLQLAWTPAKAAYLVLGVLGGACTEGAMQTVLSATAFRYTSAFPWFLWLDQVTASFGSYPQRILPPVVRGLLTFALPLAFIAYLPAAVLTGRAGGTGVPAWLVYGSPAVGPILFILARLYWNRALRRYEAVGG